ncbi:MAG: Gfo/Idh/MocA family oxidoreductase [Chloroflexota bacterium]|nr:Gfo/Idh/MocA family oxidoreductase [Chloroflexota bacterium]
MVERETLRVGVIGCGAGAFHLEGYAANPRVKIVALSGLDGPRCQELVSKFGVPHLYGDYSELLAHPDIDAVSIAVPNHLHRPIAVEALRSGKHVLVEKPLSRTVAEGEEIVAVAKEVGKVLSVSFQRRSRHDVQLVRHQIQGGALGQIYHAKAFWMRRSGIPGLGTWFTNKEHSGGGPLIDLGVHVLDLAFWLIGHPTPISVSAATYAELGPKGRGQWSGARFNRVEGVAYEVEDFATAFIRFEGGVTLSLDVSWAAYTAQNDEFGVSLLGTEGGAEIRAKDYAQVGTLQLFGEIDDTPTITEPRLLANHGHTGTIANFVNSVLDGAPVESTGEEALDLVRLIRLIYRSAELGRELRIPEDINV